MDLRRWIALPVVLVMVAACSGDDDTAPGDAGVDGGEAGGGPGGGGGSAETGLGAPCMRNGDCDDDMVCDRELGRSYLVEDLPGGGDRVPAPVFPGGSCTPVAAAPYDPSGRASCDPLVPRALQGCGSDGQCELASELGETWVACRKSCTPSQEDSGCDRRFYTCDFVLRACIEGCQSDEECRLRLIDGDGDGLPDALGYDADSLAQCDLDTYRCTHPGPGAGVTGDPCERLDDCEPDGTCIQAADPLAGHSFPGGMCTKLGCDVEGRECAGEGAVCARLRSWDTGVATALTCLKRCTVGAEPEADRFGPEGHGEGCRPGYRCHYNGGEGAESGVCVGGNYNEVTENNLGAACESDADCYSPYGLGSCLLLAVGDVDAPTGVCSILDCNAPGLPDDICGDGAQCLGLSGDLTFCVATCTSAEQCAEGYACVDEDANPSTARLCWPACAADEDCRAGERCARSGATGIGSCVASAP